MSEYISTTETEELVRFVIDLIRLIAIFKTPKNEQIEAEYRKREKKVKNKSAKLRVKLEGSKSKHLSCVM